MTPLEKEVAEATSELVSGTTRLVRLIIQRALTKVAGKLMLKIAAMLGGGDQDEEQIQRVLEEDDDGQV